MSLKIQSKFNEMLQRISANLEVLVTKKFEKNSSEKNYIDVENEDTFLNISSDKGNAFLPIKKTNIIVFNYSSNKDIDGILHTSV